MNQRVAIVQSYIPQYRVPFFDGLVRRLADSAIDCVVVAGQQRQWASARGHPEVAKNWLRQAGDQTEIAVGSTGPRFCGYGTDRHWRDCDGVVLTHRGTNVDLSLELLKKKFTRRRIGVWGHLSRSVKAPNPLDLGVERWQMRRSDHIFAYTQEGANIAVERGVSPRKVTAVMNSVDISGTVLAYADLDDADIDRFSTQHSLVPGKTFGYIGGLDAQKRVDFLVEFLDHMWQTDRDVKVLIAGRGNQEGLLSSAAERGQAIMLGYGGPTEKALISRVSQAIVNPGRIGLVAVDCLATGIPILTTDWDFHAPEFDYLTPGLDVFTSTNDVSAFATLVSNHKSDEGSVREHIGRPYPTIQDMIENFASGVEAMLE